MTAYTGSIHTVISKNVSRLESASVLIRLKKLVMFILVGLFLGGIAWGIGYLFDINWLKNTGYGIFGLCVIIAVFVSLNAQTALCPYCGGILGTGSFDTITKNDENEQLECSHCHQWLISNEGQVRAFNEEDAAKKKYIDAPVFEDGVWPNECIACGAKTTRTMTAEKNKVELSQLLIGTLSVASGSIKGVPYCDAHGDIVKLDIKDDCLRLVFPDLEMQKRYLEVNKGKTNVVKIKS